MTSFHSCWRSIRPFSGKSVRTGKPDCKSIENLLFCSHRLNAQCSVKTARMSSTVTCSHFVCAANERVNLRTAKISRPIKNEGITAGKCYKTIFCTNYNRQQVKFCLYLVCFLFNDLVKLNKIIIFSPEGTRRLRFLQPPRTISWFDLRKPKRDIWISTRQLFLLLLLFLLLPLQAF